MEILLKAQFKNGLLYRAVQKAGSQAALAKILGVSQLALGRWLNFKDVPKFRRKWDNENTRAYYDNLDRTLRNFIGVGLEEIFPPELETHKAALKEKARFEAFADMPIETLALSGAVPQLLPSPEESVLAKELREHIKDVLSELPERSAAIINRRFGLDGAGEMTLDDVAYEFGITRERVRQIEAHALRQLRLPARSRRLKGFLEGRH